MPRIAAGMVALLLLGVTSGYSRPGSSDRDPGLKLALVDQEPRPGAARIHLDQAVTQVRHNYGRSLLVRVSREQEEAIRASGYAVRVFDDPERVGLGAYSFHVPAGPQNLPADLIADESRQETGTYLVKL